MTRVSFGRPFVLGIVSAVAFGAIAFALPADLQFAWLAGLLWLTLGLYVGMALMDDDRQTGIQGAFAAAVAGVLLASVRWPWLLVAAWLAHPIWDAMHHFGAIKTRIHPFTVPFCVSFDVIIAAVAAVTLLR